MLTNSYSHFWLSSLKRILIRRLTTAHSSFNILFMLFRFLNMKCTSIHEFTRHVIRKLSMFVLHWLLSNSHQDLLKKMVKLSWDRILAKNYFIEKKRSFHSKLAFSVVMDKKLLFVMLMMNLIRHNSSDEKVLSRHKRYLVFPTGSSFSVAVCMTIGVYGNPQFSMFRWKFNFNYESNLWWKMRQSCIWFEKRTWLFSKCSVSIVKTNLWINVWILFLISFKSVTCWLQFQLVLHWTIFRLCAYSWGLNWGFAYELPTNISYFKGIDISVAKEKRSIETKPMKQRRHRRDLYSRMEVAMEK